MTTTSPQAFLMSATLHATVAGLLFLLGYIISTPPPDHGRVFELVAGEGDNFMAKEAPLLGTPGGVKMELPPLPQVKPTPPAPVQQEVTPAVQPAPPPPKPVTPAPAPPKPATDTAVPNFKKKLVHDVIVAESKAKMQIKKERAAEQKRVAEEEKRLTKEEFDRKNSKAKQVASAPAKNPAVKKIDVDGIAKGVVGGSANNKVGGAGGKALTNDNDDVLAAYDMLFKQKLREKFEPPPGLSDSLKVTIEVRSLPDGTLAGARVVKTSGSNDYDQSVLDAIKRVRMPARPDKKAEAITFVFAMRERGEG
jgi:colicin import membrane protein